LFNEQSANMNKIKTSNGRVLLIDYLKTVSILQVTRHRMT